MSGPSLGGGTVTVGEAARLTGVSAKMIRWYEAKGLLPPASRTAANYRRYGEAEIRTLHFVRRARDLGFDVEAIGELLALWHDRERPSAAVKAIAQARLAELRRRISALEGMARSLERLASDCCGDDRPDCPILDDLAAWEAPRRKRALLPSPLRGGAGGGGGSGGTAERHLAPPPPHKGEGKPAKSG